jgi:hypothetical protein
MPSSQQYTQTNDYSFNASDGALTSWNHVVLLVSGSVAFGVAP